MKEIIIKDILSKIEYNEYIGKKEQIITSFIAIDVNNKNSDIICWVNDKNIDVIPKLKTGTIVVSKASKEKLNNINCNFILVDNPRSTFREILNHFFVEKQIPSIAQSAKIDKSVIIGKNVYIGENVVIDKNCKIGDNCIIKHNTVITSDTIIHNNVLLGSNNTIGGIGFGYEKDKNGNFQVIPHLGNVILKENVEIGNNTCIDRAVLGSTILEENVKVDNLVHIAHGVKIKRNSVVIANSMVAGSVVIGENSWIAPSAAILNQKTIGNNSLVGLGAVVVKDVGDNEIVAGNPAKFIKNTK